MRFLGTLTIALGTVALSLATASAAWAADDSNSAHVCGDTSLSSTEQSACRSQMGEAKTAAQRAQIQRTYQARATEAYSDGTKANPTLTPVPAERGAGTLPAGNPPDASYPPATNTPAPPPRQPSGRGPV